MRRIWESFKQYGIVPCLAVLLGMGIGRCSKPAEIREKVRTVEVAAKSETSTAKAEEHKAEDVEHKAGTTRIIKYVYRKDGSIAAKTETDKAETSTAKHTEAGKKTEGTKSKTEYLYRDKFLDRVVVTSKRPDWLVGVDVGTSLPGLAGKSVGGLALPYAGVVGVSVDRRVVGPVHLGLWGNTAGMVGVRVAGSF